MTFFRESHNGRLCFGACVGVVVVQWTRAARHDGRRRHAVQHRALRSERLGLSEKLCKMPFHRHSHNCPL
ncbi:hypothetical protein DB771_20270 [Burkholderia sp. AU29985]|nr:hypothetical protein EGY28_01625 [Burkholderia dolosa]PRE51412.1 hypothetical protein C6P87_10615 [Burkholderia sp. AU12872]PUA75126.1 hypothetical protein DB771_20270 [Burkholderia sp. AU29985]